MYCANVNRCFSVFAQQWNNMLYQMQYHLMGKTTSDPQVGSTQVIFADGHLEKSKSRHFGNRLSSFGKI